MAEITKCTAADRAEFWGVDEKPRLTERHVECATCHRVFSGITNFDAHRTGKWGPGEPRCVDPAEVGLVRRLSGLWAGEPMSDEEKAAAFGNGAQEAAQRGQERELRAYLAADKNEQEDE